MNIAKRQFSGTIGLLLLGTACAAYSAGAHAQETAPADGQDIVVTAERIGAGNSRASALLTSQDIDERPLGADITQSLAKVPGLQVSTGDARGGSFSFELYLRGLNKEQVGLTLDGIPTGDARFNGGSPPQRFIESSNIARIQVSQSAGDIGAPSRFALGGFVDFVTDDPKDELSATVEAGLGSDDFNREYFRIDSGEIVSGLKGYLSFSRQENDVWAGPESRKSQRDHAELKIVKDWADGSFLKARVSYNDQKDNDFNIVTLPEFLNDPRDDRATDVISGIPNVDVDYGGGLGGTRKDLMAYLNGRLQISDQIRLDINPYYQELDGESFRYQNRRRILTGGDPRAVLGYNATGGATRPALRTLRNGAVVGGPADMRVTPRDRERYGVTTELRAADVISGHVFRVGGWWEGSSSTEARNFYPILDSAQSIAYDRNQLNYVEYDRSADIDVLMLYAQDSVELIADVLRIDAGIAWMDVKYKAQSPLEYAQNISFSQDSGVHPKLAFSLKPVSHVEIFGGYAQNFAGIPEDAFLGSTAVINPGQLDPIETENFDLGVRYTRGKFAFSVQGYSNRLKNNVGIVPRDLASADPDDIIRGNVATKAANIGGIRTKGLEVTALGDLGLVDFYGAYSYQDARHDDPAVGSAERAALASLAIIGGARVRDIPRHSVFGQIGVKPVERLRIQASARYAGSRVGGHIVSSSFDEIGVETIPSYTVVNAGASYDFKPMGPFQDIRLQFNVDNLFDENYIGAVTSATNTLPEFGASLANPSGRSLDRYFIGAPRTFTASLRVRF